jgi:tellurite resistance protein
MTAIDCVGQPTRKTLLDVLTVVAWADGRLTEQEREFVRGAALAFGAVDMDCVHVEETTRLADVGLNGLTVAERHIVYACAAWTALADDVQSPSESLALHQLRDRLGLSADEAQRLQDAAYLVRLDHADDARRWREVTKLVVDVARSARGTSSSGLAA